MSRPANRGLGRRLQIGQTDLTSALRTPSSRLRIIPAAARTSFIPPAIRIPELAAGENDLTRRNVDASCAAGEPIVIKGLVIDELGRPRPNTLVEAWNANTYGRYDHPDDPARVPLDPLFAGFGRTITDADGQYAFLTIRPAPYLARPDIGRWRPAHIHLSLAGAAIRLVTQMYFPHDPLLVTDPSFQLLGDAAPRQIGVPGSTAEGLALYQFDIVVAGLRETWLTAEKQG